MNSLSRIRTSETVPGSSPTSVCSALAIRHSRFICRGRKTAGFTLIELLVAVGLMALMMSMIATIFFQATSSFRMARASVEIHQNARGTFSLMTNDLVAARFCNYEDKTGYFALGWIPDSENGYPVQALSFTSLAEQTGARPLVPGVSPQVVLVRYTLQAAGTPLIFDGDDPDTATVEDSYERQVFNLVKQVRFPQLVYPFVDMNEFNSIANPGEFTPDEWVTTDVLSFGVLEMKLRILYEGDYLDVVDHGRCSASDVDSLFAAAPDATRSWPDLTNMYVQLLGGYAAPQGRNIVWSGGTQLDVLPVWGDVPLGGETSFRIENPPTGIAFTSTTGPEWLELPDRASEVVTGTTYEDAKMYPMIVIEDIDGEPPPTPNMDANMPYVVEVTLQQADAKGTRFHTFTQRLYLPASEQR